MARGTGVITQAQIWRVLALAIATAWGGTASPANPSLLQAIATGNNGSTNNAALSGIAHVAIRVADLERSRAFFHKLGFEEAFAMNNGGAPTEAFFKVNDRQFIELYPRKGPEDWVGLMHICRESPDLNGLYQDYVAHGLTPTPVRRAGAGNLLFTLQGPEEPGLPSDLRPRTTQNIEYTQYMPGSRHTLDRGQHLRPDRVADRIAGVGIPMSDPAAATSFYEDRLLFRRAASPLERGYEALELSGARDQRVELLPATAAPENALHFRIIFGVANLRTTQTWLRALGFTVKKSRSELAIEDPDGDAVIFVAAGGG